MRLRYVEKLGLTPAAALTLTQHPGYARFFESACAAFPQPVKVANWVVNEVLRGASTHGLDAKFSVTPAQVAELLALVESGDISGKQAKEVYAAVEGSDKSPKAVVEERGMKVVSNASELQAICERVLAANPSQAESFRAGKKGVLGFLVGQVMKETKGSANPKLVNELLEKLLVGPN
jgi:aspartyl-tRNA(Asn)/glutamyl-tRNA(Gln) amidotransferase subunit B